MLNRIGREFNQHSGCHPYLVPGLHRADEELDEAFEAAGKGDLQAVAEEIADVILVLSSLAQHLGYDLDTIVQRKHEVNMAREWAPHPTIPGSVQHVKEMSAKEKLRAQCAGTILSSG